MQQNHPPNECKEYIWFTFNRTVSQRKFNESFPNNCISIEENKQKEKPEVRAGRRANTVILFQFSTNILVLFLKQLLNILILYI